MIMIFLYLHPDLYNIVSTFFSAYGEVLSVKQTVRNNSVLFQRQATPQVTFVKKKSSPAVLSVSSIMIVASVWYARQITPVQH